MKTNHFNKLMALMACAALAAPLTASAWNPGDSRHAGPGGRPEERHFQPQGWSHPHREYRPHFSGQVMMVPGYYPPPPPPPPVVYWGYYPPPPPIYYPCPRPGFNIVLTF